MTRIPLFPMILPALALAACSSPLDVPTDRIETRLTNGIKFREMTVSAHMERGVVPGDSITVEWNYMTTASSFMADTTANPPLFRMHREMHPMSHILPGCSLRELEIDISNLEAEGSHSLFCYPTSKNFVRALVEIGTTQYRSASGDNASITIHYRNPGKRLIKGTLVLGMNRSPEFTLLVVVNFTASQD